MASSTAAQSWQFAQQAEAQVKALMKNKDFPTYQEIDHALIQLRTACEAVIFADFEYATSVGVEQRLWNVHTMINSRYRKLMDHHKKGHKNHVERRATAKHYADFIKTTQFFYKSYIQRLGSHFDGMEELHRIARSLSLSLLAADRPVTTSPEVKGLVELSCHSALLHLGDLSRYRNALRTKDRSWEPAMGYYALANDFLPTNGHAHNQMAVIALADENHLDAVYHIYRALTTESPPEVAKGNLETEFKKILTAWEKKLPHQSTDNLSMLSRWFVILHAKFYKGMDFSTREELEKEVLSRVVLLLKGQSFCEVLEKLVMINIAAQAFAKRRYQEDNAATETITSLRFCLGFNIQIFITLLQILLPELEDQSTGEDIPTATNESRPERKDLITAVARRVLPALRQYSAWLIANTKYILAMSTVQSPDTATIALNIQEMWKTYSIVLTKLVQLFPVEHLASIEYLLEEDESTVGFKPLRDPELPNGCDLFKAIDGKVKPRVTDAGQERSHPNLEMQSRIRDIVLIGLSLHIIPEIPVKLDQSNGRNVFLFVKEIASPLHPEFSFFPTPTHTSSTFSPREPVSLKHDDFQDESVAAFDAHHTMENDMLRMVDDLVEPSSNGAENGSDETSYGMHSLTANEVFAPIGPNGYDSQIRSTPKMLPSMPDFHNSAFIPQPHELKPTSPHRPPTRGQLSPLSLETNKQRQDAAAALEEMTGYSRSGHTSWGRQSSLVGSGTSYKPYAKQFEEGLDDPIDRPPINSSWGRKSSRPTSGSLPRPVSQMLQESLAQQYMPVSSGFSDSSSLYANTTPPPARNGVVGARNGVFGAANGNNSTIYAGASDFDRDTMLQSSLWNGSQPVRRYFNTPPGGQGG